MPIQLTLVHIIELVAALAGTYYYFHTDDKLLRPFVWYLWFIVVVETFGLYGYLMQYNFDNETFIWLKNSGFCENIWLYNIFSFITIIFYWFFYRRIIRDEKARHFLNILLVVYILFAIGYFIMSDGFFFKSIPYDEFLATLFIFVAVMCYYRELLQGNKVLYFYKEPIFYISTGLLIWHLTIIPLMIFSRYFTLINERFIGFHQNYILIVNLFLYSCYTFGFLYTVQFRRQLQMKKSP